MEEAQEIPGGQTTPEGKQLVTGAGGLTLSKPGAGTPAVTEDADDDE